MLPPKSRGTVTYVAPPGQYNVTVCIIIVVIIIIIIFAAAHASATEAGAAANQTVANKIAKYDELAGTHIFYPVGIKTRGTWNQWAVELVQEIGRRATLITGEPRESTFLFQQLSIALQMGNAVAFLNTFDSD